MPWVGLIERCLKIFDINGQVNLILKFMKSFCWAALFLSQVSCCGFWVIVWNMITGTSNQQQQPCFFLLQLFEGQFVRHVDLWEGRKLLCILTAFLLTFRCSGGRAAKDPVEICCGSYCQAVLLQWPAGKWKEKFPSEIVGRKRLANGMNEDIRSKTILKRESLVGMCKSDMKFPSARMLK